MKFENCVLNEIIKSLENDLETSKIQLIFFSSDKLDCLLNSQKLHSDRGGLGSKSVGSSTLLLYIVLLSL